MQDPHCGRGAAGAVLQCRTSPLNSSWHQLRDSRYHKGAWGLCAHGAMLGPVGVSQWSCRPSLASCPDLYSVWYRGPNLFAARSCSQKGAWKLPQVLLQDRANK
ncbi:unnamed protein product [Lepidochelys kempii]